MSLEAVDRVTAGRILNLVLTTDLGDSTTWTTPSVPAGVLS